ncbi:MAG TPA: menaquinone biosynthesis protein [Vicinamibacterales bacterium]|nr:menaquinone biosynthesis protein [Vicinamibacterales bacterium]
MAPIRLGAVDYLNARPLVHGLDRRPDLFSLRFDPPSRCAALLHEHAVDLGMIPSIEYHRGPTEYRIVPGMAIVSRGPVASVALFTKVPVERVRTIAADTSSRTSNALLRILCVERFGIAPDLRPMPPDAAAMLAAADAALIIGDPALYLDPAAHGVEKIDLGAEWTALTGRPFVWAFWAGRPGAAGRDAVAELTAARDAGVAAADAIAEAYCGPARAEQGREYLRHNICYAMGSEEVAGLRQYYALAARHQLIPEAREPQFYES